MSNDVAKASGLNRAKPYQLVLFPFNNGATNVYYILTITYIAYYGNGVPVSYTHLDVYKRQLEAGGRYLLCGMGADYAADRI